jgi:hypothetical protein
MQKMSRRIRELDNEVMRLTENHLTDATETLYKEVAGQ